MDFMKTMLSRQSIIINPPWLASERAARVAFRTAGALVDNTQTVRIGRDMVAAALSTAPRSIRQRAADWCGNGTFAL